MQSKKCVWRVLGCVSFVVCVGILTFYFQVSHDIHVPLERTIGQLIAICVRVDSDRSDIEAACKLINRYNIGSVLLCGAGVNKESPLEHDIEALNIITTICKRRPLILQDFEWGPAFFLTGVPNLPRPLTCGAIQDDALIYQYGREIGRMCRLLGVDINLAPVVDVNSNPLNPVIGSRSFGSDPINVAHKAVLYMRGLVYEGIGACAKHFPGHGDTAIDSHEDLQVINRTKRELENTELYPFEKMIEAGVPSIMSAHILVRAYDNKPATLSPAIMTDLLRKKMGFEGVVMSDALNMKALTKYFDQGTLALAALKAGCDILLAPEDVGVAIKTIADAVRSGKISEQEVLLSSDRVARLRADFLHAHTGPLSVDEVTRQLNEPQTAELNKRLYRAAITLVRDKQHLLPLRAHDAWKYMQIGGQPNTLFSQRLIQQTKVVDHLLVPTQAQMGAQQRSTFLDRIAGSDVVLTLFDVDGPGKRRALVTAQLADFVKDVYQRAKHVVLVVCGNPYSLAFFTQAQTVLMAYEDEPAAQEAAADVLAGVLEARGQLPVKI